MRKISLQEDEHKWQLQEVPGGGGDVNIFHQQDPTVFFDRDLLGRLSLEQSYRGAFLSPFYG